MSLQTGLLDYLFSNKILPAEIYTVVFFAAVLVVIAVSYLLGSINSAIIVSRLVYHDDVRKHGSGNPGLTIEADLVVEHPKGGFSDEMLTLYGKTQRIVPPEKR